MTAALPFVSTLDGSAITLAAPEITERDIRNNIAPALGKLPRFNGAVPLASGGRQWSVADHLIVGADLLKGPGSAPVQLYYLLHDAHEALIGDIISPVKWEIERRMQTLMHGGGIVFAEAIARLKGDIDAAIYRALDIPPPPRHIAATVKQHDLRMLVTERNHLMARQRRNWGPLENIPPLTRIPALAPLKGGPEAKAQAWLDRLYKWLPLARAAATHAPQPPAPAPAAAE